MDFLHLAKMRYSARKYLDKKVESEKLQKILEAGRIAPTGANRQPQRLIVVQEPENLKKISNAANIFHAPLAIIVCADISEAWVRPFDGKNISDIDTSIVTDHMMLQATELGLGSVWVCYFKPDVLRKEFSIPNNLEPVHILVLGYASESPLSPERHVSSRKALTQTVFYEQI